MQEREEGTPLRRVETGMADHDVAIDRDCENAEEADCNEAVSQERKQSTEKWSVQPRTVPECGSCEW